jgi:hypothetical protein
MLKKYQTLLIILLFVSGAIAQQKKPNIVVIWGDDIGMWNVGAYTHGMMGRTPNIDGIARDGMLLLQIITDNQVAQQVVLLLYLVRCQYELV